MGSGGDLGTELFFFSRWRPKEILERDDRESKKNKIIWFKILAYPSGACFLIWSRFKDFTGNIISGAYVQALSHD